MDQVAEQRSEERLCDNHPMWYTNNGEGALCRADMVDVNSSAIAFTCCKGKTRPQLGQQIETKFFVHQFEPDGYSYYPKNFIRSGHICRVDNLGLSHRIAMQFAEPLPFKPGEQMQNSSESGTKQEPLHASV